MVGLSAAVAGGEHTSTESTDATSSTGLPVEVVQSSEGDPLPGWWGIVSSDSSIISWVSFKFGDSGEVEA